MLWNVFLFSVLIVLRTLLLPAVCGAGHREDEKGFFEWGAGDQDAIVDCD